MRKRLLAIVMSAAMVLSLVPSLAFATVDPADRVEHTHDYTAATGVTIYVKDGEVLKDTDAKCGSTILRANKCECGEYDLAKAKVLGTVEHNFTKDGTDGNCVETWENWSCENDNCTATEKRNVQAIPNGAHDFATTKTVITPATCTEKAKMAYKCSKCDEVEGVAEVGSALGHDFATLAVKADGTPDYEKDYADGVCEKTAATCIAEGKYVYTCRRDGCNETKEFKIDKVDHVYETVAVIKNATCTTPEISAYCCATPGCPAYINEFESAKANGHEWNAGEVKEAATCTKDGVKEFECTVCEATKTEAIKASGHNYAKVRVSVKPATCTEAEILAFPCLNEITEENDGTTTYGSYSDPIEGDPATGHSKLNEVEWEPVYATCTENRYMAKYCKECGTVIDKRELTAEEIAALEEDGIDWKATGHAFILKDIKEATCSQEGLRTYVCMNWDNEYSDCGFVKEETIAKLPHTVVDVPAVAATYTKTGLTKGQKCSVCDETILAQTTVAKKVLAQAKTPTVKAGKGYIKVSYKAVKDATGYQIVVKRSGEKKVVTVKSAKAATKTIKKLKSGKTYKVYVRAYRTEGKTTVYGKYAPVKSIKVK